MKFLPLAVVASAAFATASARADHMSFRGFFRFGGPACAPAPVYCPPYPVYCPPPAPVYCPPPAAYCPPPVVNYAPAGHWNYVSRNVWIPGRCVTTYDMYGCPTTYEVPGHYEVRTERVWVNDGDCERRW